MHFNPDLPLVLTTDATSQGIAAVLSHTLPNGEERLISCASRTLTAAKEKYSVIQKESLAIYFGTIKFH